MKVLKVFFISTIVLCFFNGSLTAQNYTLDEQMGEEAFQMVESQIGIYEHPGMQAYLATIGSELLRNYQPQPFQFRFYIADSEIPNAFALPGGYIFATRGFLMLPNSEDELASVISHEMFHVLGRHSVKQMKKSILPSLLKIPGALIGTFVNEDIGRIINTPVDFGGSFFLSSYSRGHEKESDKEGIQLAAKTGYDPYALGVILSRLSNYMTDVTGEEESFSYFSSHPFTPKRVDYINKAADKIAKKSEIGVKDTKGEYILSIDGLLIGQNPEQGIIRENSFFHPGIDMYYEFPEDWNLINTPAALAGMNEEGEAIIVLSPVESDNDNAIEEARNFEKKLRRNAPQVKIEADSTLVNGLDTYFVNFSMPSEQGDIYIKTYWLNLNGIPLRLTTAGLGDYQSILKESVQSLRHLNESEDRLISTEVLYIEPAKQDESLSQFANRVQTNWEVSQIAIVNGLQTDVILNEGQQLKISKTVHYSEIRVQ